MTAIDERTAANMEVVLNEVCRGFRHGGDHEVRKHIASQIMKAAESGLTHLDGLRGVARKALQEVVERKTG